MKNARKDDEKYRLLKPRFKSNSEITDKCQNIVELIFGELKVDDDIILYEEYSSYDESDEYQSRGNKNPKPKLFRIAGIPESSCTNEWKLSILILDMLVFDGYFDSYVQRQLVVDYTNYNKDG